MYQITVVMTCNGKDCEEQITERIIDSCFNDGIFEIKKELKKQGINPSVSLCPKCVEKSRLEPECQCERCDSIRKR